MTPDWTPLEQEMVLWVDQGLQLPLWWRDDDAIAATSQLDRLAALSRKLKVPVHLAIIPSLAEGTLADYVTAHPELIPVVHGWAHKNHAEAGSKKCEFGDNRPLACMREEVAEALTRLQGLFGDSLTPMFVPPWNRISERLIAKLPMLGYSTLSTFTPRNATEAAPQLTRINTHLDPIDWNGTRSLCPPDMLIQQVTQQLQDRRRGLTDNSEPYGILTHHLVHDAAIWTFTADLISRLMSGPGIVWTNREGKPSS